MFSTGSTVARSVLRGLLPVSLLVLAACGGASAGGGAQEASSGDAFEDNNQRIRSVVPGWNEGAGINIKFLKEATGERLSLLFVDSTAPAWNEGQGLWIIQGIAQGPNNETLAHVLIGLRDLRPGTYEGSENDTSLVLAVAITDQPWNGQAEDAGWSINANSFARLVLRDIGNGNLEGDFQAKLVTNEGSSYYTLEAGYILINK